MGRFKDIAMEIEGIDPPTPTMTDIEYYKILDTPTMIDSEYCKILVTRLNERREWNAAPGMVKVETTGTRSRWVSKATPGRR